MADRHGQWPELFKSNRVRRVAKAASCTFILCSFGYLLREPLEGAKLYLSWYAVYLTNDRHTTIKLRRHPMNADGVCL